MKKHYALGLVTAFVAALGLATAAPAMATDCVPKDAWVEHIDHPATGEPKITVDNPDYKPATEDWTEVVHHDAEPDTTTYIHHDRTPDVTEVTGYMKWNWTGGKQSEPTTAPPSDGWHQVGITSDSKGNTPDTIIHQGNGYGSYFYFETQTSVTPGTPAWDEPVVTPGKAAWDENVLHAGTPAVETPTIEIDNPDYKAAWTEDKNHEAVYCPGPKPAAVITYDVTGGDLTCNGWTASTEKAYTAEWTLNEEGSKWVLGTPVLTSTTPYPGFEATWDEKAQIECARPAEVSTNLTSIAATCDAGGKTIESVVTTPWVIEDYTVGIHNERTLKGYFPGETTSVDSVIATTPRLVCVTVPELHTAPADISSTTITTPSTAPVSAELAQTGSKEATWVPIMSIGAISLVAVGTLIVIMRRRKSDA